MRLNYDEFKIWNNFLDFWVTGQIMTKNREERDIIISLKGKAIEFQSMLGEKKNANNRR